MKRGVLRSKRVVKIASSVVAVALSAGLVVGGVMHFKGIKNQELSENNNVVTTVSLSETKTAIDLAKEFNVQDLIGTDENGNIVRFEANKSISINVIVDENGEASLSDTNIKAIKNAVVNYNDVFRYINSDIRFRYIPKQEYEKIKDDNPYIFISAQETLDTSKGELWAVTNPRVVTESKSNNGKVTQNATIKLGLKDLEQLDEEQQTAVVSHAFAHSLGVQNHSQDTNSTMATYGNMGAVASEKLSKDTLLALYSLYYNENTNHRSKTEVLGFIESQDKARREELKKEGFNSQYASEIQRKYAKYVEIYINSVGVSVDDPNKMIGNNYTNNNMLNVKTSVSFKPDGTYDFTIKTNGGKKTVSGKYTIENQTIVCDGPYFDFDGTKINMIEGEKLYFNSLSNNTCIYGDASSGAIKNILTISESINER